MEQDRLSIAIYTSGDFPYGGAPESFVRQMALGLYENNCQVEVIRWRGSRFNHKNDTPVKLTNYLFRKPAKYDFFKLFELICLVAYIPFSLAYQKFFKKDKVVMLYGLEYMYIVLPFLLWTRFLKMKCYRILTDKYRAESIAPVWWKKPKLFFYNFQQKYFDRYLDGMIVLSNYLYNQSLKNNVKKHRLLLIHHFIDLTTVNAPQKNAYDKLIIGYCGHVSIGNGVLDLVEAFILFSEKYPEAELIIIGAISADMKQELLRKNYQDYNIRLTGMLGKQEVVNELSKCNILVNPRQKGEWAEAGFPTKIGEYFALKKPVISTSVGDLPFYLKDNEQLVFVEAENPKSIVVGINYLIKQKNIADRIGINGFVWAKSNLDYHENSKRLIQFICYKNDN